MEITKCESMIMMIVWSADHHMTMAEILNNVNKKYNKGWKSQTVSTYLRRLVKKGFLGIYREEHCYKYNSLLKQECAFKILISDHVKIWCDGDYQAFASNVKECENVDINFISWITESEPPEMD